MVAVFASRVAGISGRIGGCVRATADILGAVVTVKFRQ